MHVDIRGQRFVRLVAVEVVGSAYGGKRTWRCLCDCGREVVVAGNSLRTGNTKSCGCLHRERAVAWGKSRKRHGRSASPTWKTWRSMLSRAHFGSSKDRSNYLDRGIDVCERWLKFENFLEDMGERPDGLSLDRVNNERGYSKENCRWATHHQQARNRRTSRLITVKGETMTLAEWCERIGIDRGTVSSRLRAGLTPEQALFSPVRGSR